MRYYIYKKNVKLTPAFTCLLLILKKKYIYIHETNIQTTPYNKK